MNRRASAGGPAAAVRGAERGSGPSGRSARPTARSAGCALGGRAAGFTLLEVLIALAILSVCLMAIYQGYSTSLSIATATRKLWKAMEYSHNELARWERMSPPPDVSVAQGDFPPNDPMWGYSWRREITDLEPLPGVRVRRIQLDVTWPFGTSTQIFRASLYVLPR